MDVAFNVVRRVPARLLLVAAGGYGGGGGLEVFERGRGEGEGGLCRELKRENM